MHVPSPQASSPVAQPPPAEAEQRAPKDSRDALHEAQDTAAQARQSER